MYKQLLIFLLKRRWQFLISLLLSITLTTAAISLLALSGWFISAAAFAGLAATLAANFNYFMPAAIIRFLALIRILTRYFDRVVSHDATFKILTSLRVWFYEKLIPLSPARLMIKHSGALLNQMVNDITTLDQLYLNVLSPFLIALLLLIALTVFVGFFSKIISIVIFIMLLLTYITLPLIAFKQGNVISEKIQKTTAFLRVTLVDCLQGFSDLLLFENKNTRLNMIQQSHDACMQAQKQLAHLKGLIIALMQIFSGVTVLLILWFGIPDVLSHHINGAIFAMIILLVIASFEQLVAFPLSCLSLTKSISASKRLQEITSQKPAVIFTSTSQHAGFEIHNPDAIVINHISFCYPEKSSCAKLRGISHLIFDNFSLNIPAGKKIGITGPSGSGKSTLLQLLARIWDPFSGEIIIGDENLKSFSENHLRQTLSLVTQQLHIFNASVRDNLTLMRTDISDDACHDVLKRMQLEINLNDPMGEFGKYFSGGQCRRIAIARALLYNTPILLLDEPTTGLEDGLFEKIWKNCEDLLTQKTVVIATHNQAVLDMMDDICHL